MSNLEPEFRTRPDLRRRGGAMLGWIIGGAVVLLLLVAIAGTWGPTSENNPRNISEATKPAEPPGSATTGSATQEPASNVPPATAPAR
jgi:hypothetical protein